MLPNWFQEIGAVEWRMAHSHCHKRLLPQKIFYQVLLSVLLSAPVHFLRGNVRIWPLLPQVVLIETRGFFSVHIRKRRVAAIFGTSSPC
jgi:hypothetical protein